MKLTVAMILLTAFQVTAAGEGHAQNVTLQLRQAEIPKVFRAIEKQSPYRFLYNYDLPALQRKVDVDVKNTPVLTVLNDLLAGSGLGYRIMNNRLVVIVSTTADNAAVNKTVTGTILSEAGEPLAGVSVRIKGTDFGTTTDAKGKFSLEVPENAVLVFSYVGFDPQEVTVGAQQTINIKLKPADSQMEQVVVVGYGTQKKKDLTGSVSTLTSKDLENRPTSQFGYAIEGKAAGVQVIRSISANGDVEQALDRFGLAAETRPHRAVPDLQRWLDRPWRDPGNEDGAGMGAFGRGWPAACEAEKDRAIDGIGGSGRRKRN